MTDIHTHILPKIDDGASSIDESRLLINSLITQNIKRIVLTPHFYPFEMPIDIFVEKREKSFYELLEATNDMDCELIIGAEVQYNDIIFNNDDLKELCIAKTDYMLLELPYTDKFEGNFLSKIDRFIDKYGIIPIIAHVERYLPIQKNRKIVQDLKEMGCIIQINCDSLVFKSKEHKTAQKLLKMGLCDVLGSDCHNIEHRPPLMEKALNEFERICGKEAIEYTNDVIDRILLNEIIGF